MSVRTWSLREGSRIALYTRQEAWAAGYLVALYGSTLKGTGRDLDLLAVPWRPGPDFRDLVRAVEHVANAKQHRVELGLHGKRSVVLYTEDQRAIDLHVRPEPSEPIWRSHDSEEDSR